MRNNVRKKKGLGSRIFAIIVAAIIALLAVLIIWIAFYRPDANKNKDIKFDVDGNQSLISDDDSYNFLVCGHDRAANLTDVIMLINYNLKDQKVTILQIPRDTFVNVDDYFYHKANGLYSYYYAQACEKGSQNPEKESIHNVATYLEKNLAVKIHYSTVMDLDGFAGIVDAIGGVDMYVPQSMYYVDISQNLTINLQEGYQHLDGDKAEQFVRFRYGYVNGDLGRENAQKLFVSAFISKLQSSVTNVSVLSSLINNIVEYVYTDISINDFIFFAKAFVGLSTKDAVKMSDVTIMTLPGDGAMYDYMSMYVMNRQYAIDLINEYFNIYDYDIEKSFDKYKAFVTEEDYTDIANIYYADKDTVYFTKYDAGSLEENGLN